MSIDLHFTGEDWERIERDWPAWWARDLSRPMVIIETTHQMIMPNEAWTREFVFERPAEKVIDYVQAWLEAKRFYGDAWPRWFPNFGPGILAGMLGANVKCMPTERTVWFELETGEIEELSLSFDPENPWWKRVREVTAAAVERFGDKVSVGHTDIGGNLDVLSSFRAANRLMLDLIDAPEQVMRLSREITRAFLECYDRLDEVIEPAGRGTSGWAEIWSPGRTYMLQSDFSFMISPRMFNDFVAPDLEACCERLDHPFYHLDGKGQIVHVDRLLAIEKLAGIQWIPGAGQPQPEEWMPLLKKIRDGGKLCQIYVTAQGARKIVKELGGRGFALYIVPAPPMTREQAEDFLKTLEQDDPNPW